ncbi:MAG TPA: hypothetical protein VGF99_01770, partial [Myxococcota bacterium]
MKKTPRPTSSAFSFNRRCGRKTIAILAGSLLFASSTMARSVAVVGFHDPGMAADTATSDGVRATLPRLKRDDVVIDVNQLRTRLRGPMGAPTSLVAVKTTLAAADEAAGAVEHERAIALFESAIAQLENDNDFSLDKRELLQLARLRCAR